MFLGKYVCAGLVESGTTQGLVIKEHDTTMELLHQDGDIVLAKKPDAKVVDIFDKDTRAWIKQECAKRGIH